MAKVDDLIESYEEFAALPWQAGISGSERVWFAIYSPSDERRVRCRLGEFANATQRAGHEWALVDLTNAFAEWMATQDYLDAYFDVPDDIMPLISSEFRQAVAEKVVAALEAANDDTVVGILGAGALFSFVRVSEVLNDVSDHISGRLLVFFPGTHSGDVFRLLDARDGWNYRAVPITA